MSDFILHIDTTSIRGLVMISEKGVPVSLRINHNPLDHAAFVQPAIRELLDETQLGGRHLKCVAVANGPGSYTGLRVGLASAKGLCYTWQVPLCTLSSLRILALATRFLVEKESEPILAPYFLAPMIDARRMEVFYAVYKNQGLTELIHPGSIVLGGTFLENVLTHHKVCFSGDGALKWKSICNSPNARFFVVSENEEAFAQLAWQASGELMYVNLAYAEPFYTKEFFSPGFVTK